MRKERPRNQGLNTNTKRVQVGLSRERPSSRSLLEKRGWRQARGLLSSTFFCWVGDICILEGNWLSMRLKGGRMEGERQGR